MIIYSIILFTLFGIRDKGASAIIINIIKKGVQENILKEKMLKEKMLKEESRKIRVLQNG